MSKRLKLFYMLLLILTILFSSASLWGASGGFNWGNTLSQVAQVVLMLFGVPLLIKLGRKLGIDISQEDAERVMSILVNIITNVEQAHNDKDGAVKKQIALGLAERSLTREQQQLMIEKHGSLEAAVEVAFQRSHLAKNHKKKEL